MFARNSRRLILTLARAVSVQRPVAPVRTRFAFPQQTVFTRGYAEATTTGTQIPADVLNLSLEEYHDKADLTLESMLQDLEEFLDENDIPGSDVEESSGILSLTIPENGSYVINKQPPNKQLWFSSPISGPKRFDLTGGHWVSLREGVKLVDILAEEISQGTGKEFVFNEIEL